MCDAKLTLTLDGEASAALEVSDHGSVLALLAVVHALDNQLVALILREHPVVLTGPQLHVVEHPFHRDVVLGDAHLKCSRGTQK